MRPLAIALVASSLTIVSHRPTWAGGEPSAPRSDDPGASRKLDELLARWEARSRDLRGLSVKFRRIDDSRLFRTKRTYTGQLRIQGPDRLYVDYHEAKEAAPRGEFSERMVVDGNDFYHFVGLTRKVFVFRREPGTARSLLEYGPLAFVFRVNAAKLRERFEIEILREDAESYTLRAVPKRPDDRGVFSQALVKLDRTRLLPVGIRLTMPGGDSETQTYTCSLADMDENPTIKPAWFDAQAMVKSLRDREAWAVVDGGPWFGAGGSPLPPKAPEAK